MATWLKTSGSWMNRTKPETVSVPGPTITIEASACVVYQVIRCPDCHSRRIRIYGKSGPVRYHRCLECKKCFKSLETD